MVLSAVTVCFRVGTIIVYGHMVSTNMLLEIVLTIVIDTVFVFLF